MPRIIANVLLPLALLPLCWNSLFAFPSALSFRSNAKINSNNYLFLPSSWCPNRTLQLSSNEKNENDGSDESTRLKRKAEQLREEIRTLEEILQSSNRRQMTPGNVVPTTETRKDEEESCSLRGKTVLVVGANGRLGSMVCRYLLRNNPKTQVVAAVHYVGYVYAIKRRFVSIDSNLSHLTLSLVLPLSIQGGNYTWIWTIILWSWGRRWERIYKCRMEYECTREGTARWRRSGRKRHQCCLLSIYGWYEGI